MTTPSDQAGDESLWSSQRKMMEDMFKPWAALAAAAGQPPAGGDVAEQMRGFLGNAASVAQATTRPLEDFLTAQRKYAEQMEQWADLQKKLAEQTMALAKYQQDIVESVERWTAPFRGFPSPEEPSDR
jgi:hypothetical protein